MELSSFRFCHFALYFSCFHKSFAEHVCVWDLCVAENGLIGAAVYAAPQPSSLRRSAQKPSARPHPDSAPHSHGFPFWHSSWLRSRLCFYRYSNRFWSFIPWPAHLLSSFFISPCHPTSHGLTPHGRGPSCNKNIIIPTDKQILYCFDFAVLHLFITFVIDLFLCTIIITTNLGQRIDTIHWLRLWPLELTYLASDLSPPFLTCMSYKGKC